MAFKCVNLKLWVDVALGDIIIIIIIVERNGYLHFFHEIEALCNARAQFSTSNVDNSSACIIIIKHCCTCIVYRSKNANAHNFTQVCCCCCCCGYCFIENDRKKEFSSNSYTYSFAEVHIKEHTTSHRSYSYFIHYTCEMNILI